MNPKQTKEFQLIRKKHRDILTPLFHFRWAFKQDGKIYEAQLFVREC